MPKMQEVPAASSFKNPRKAGYLDKLTGKSWLYSGSWKKRFCILDGTKLYYYEGKDSKGSERTSGVINLDYYDLCEEASAKECKRATNVFVISTSVRGFFDVKYMFAAETLDEMKSWMIHIKAAANDARKNRSRAGRARRTSSRGSRKVTDGGDNCPSTSPFREDGADGVFDVPTDVGPLPSATKDRPRGPQGRRLPHRKTLMPRDEEDKGRFRASSLSEIECASTEERQRTDDWKTRSVELDLDDANSQTSNVKRCLAYDYSSSESSIQDNSEENKGNRSLRRCLFNKNSFSSQPPTNRVTLDPKMDDVHSDQNEEGRNVRRKVMSATTTNDHTRITLVKELETRWLNDKDKRSSSKLKHESLSSNHENKNEEIEQVVSQMSSNLKVMDRELTEAKNDLGTLQEHMKNTKTSVDSTNSKVDKLTTQVQDLDKHISALSKAQDDMRTALQEFTKERESYQELKQECQELLSELKESMTKMQSS